MLPSQATKKRKKSERNDLIFEPDPQCNSGSFREVVRQLDLEYEASSFKLSGSVFQIMKPLKQYGECGTLITKKLPVINFCV